MQIKQTLIEALPSIIAQSVKPVEAIDSIKILNVEGLNGVANGTNGSAESGSVADQAVNAALKYRAQAPLLDSLMNELGLKGDDLTGLTGSVADKKLNAAE